MTDIRVTVTTMKTGAIAKDRFVNTWCFTGTDSAATMATTAHTLLKDFYKVIATPATNAVGSYLSNALSRAFGDMILKSYNLADPMPRVPILTEGNNLPSSISSTLGLPSEVAVCLSFQAARQSGVSQARRRGRVFIGPLGPGVQAGAATVFPTVDTAFSLALRSAALRMVTAGTAGTSWAVWSPTSGVARVVANGWVDDAFDTQRRRGIAASTRSTF